MEVSNGGGGSPRNENGAPGSPGAANVNMPMSNSGTNLAQQVAPGHQLSPQMVQQIAQQNQLGQPNTPSMLPQSASGDSLSQQQQELQQQQQQQLLLQQQQQQQQLGPVNLPPGPGPLMTQQVNPQGSNPAQAFPQPGHPPTMMPPQAQTMPGTTQQPQGPPLQGQQQPPFDYQAFQLQQQQFFQMQYQQQLHQQQLYQQQMQQLQQQGGHPITQHQQQHAPTPANRAAAPSAAVPKPAAPQPQHVPRFHLCILNAENITSPDGVIEKDLYTQIQAGQGQFDCQEVTKPAGVELMHLTPESIVSLMIRRRSDSSLVWHTILRLHDAAHYVGKLQRYDVFHGYLGLFSADTPLPQLDGESSDPERLFNASRSMGLKDPSCPRLQVRCRYTRPGPATQGERDYLIRKGAQLFSQMHQNNVETGKLDVLLNAHRANPENMTGRQRVFSTNREDLKNHNSSSVGDPSGSSSGGQPDRSEKKALASGFLIPDVGTTPPADPSETELSTRENSKRDDSTPAKDSASDAARSNASPGNGSPRAKTKSPSGKGSRKGAGGSSSGSGTGSPKAKPSSPKLISAVSPVTSPRGDTGESPKHEEKDEPNKEQWTDGTCGEQHGESSPKELLEDSAEAPKEVDENLSYKNYLKSHEILIICYRKAADAL